VWFTLVPKADEKKKNPGEMLTIRQTPMEQDHEKNDRKLLDGGEKKGSTCGFCDSHLGVKTALNQKRGKVDCSKTSVVS